MPGNPALHERTGRIVIFGAVAQTRSPGMIVRKPKSNGRAECLPPAATDSRAKYVAITDETYFVAGWFLNLQDAARGALFALVTFYATGAASQGQGINSNLCQEAVNSTREMSSLIKTTTELQQYLDGLMNGKYSFAWTIMPEEAAAQLGFGPRFRAAYGLLIDEAKTRMARNGRVHITEIIDYLKAIINEEEMIVRLAHDPAYTPAILFLIALEDGVCSFPYVLSAVPRAVDVLKQLRKSYPKMNLVANSAFSEVYVHTVAFAANEIQQRGVVSIYRIIEAWRRAVLESGKKSKYRSGMRSKMTRSYANGSATIGGSPATSSATRDPSPLG
jgi:hypothetical protein